MMMSVCHWIWWLPSVLQYCMVLQRFSTFPPPHLFSTTFSAFASYPFVLRVFSYCANSFKAKKKGLRLFSPALDRIGMGCFEKKTLHSTRNNVLFLSGLFLDVRWCGPFSQDLVLNEGLDLLSRTRLRAVHGQLDADFLLLSMS